MNLIGTTLGSSILASSPARGTILDASIANSTADLQRLVLISYVVTRNILRDSVMITNTYGLNNSAYDSGKPKPGVGSFVITSGEVVSLSLNTLIVVPLLWLLLWVVRAFFARQRFNNKAANGASKFTLGAIDLSPMQMYVLLSEQLPGCSNWLKKEREMPYVNKVQWIETSSAMPSKASDAIETASEKTSMLEAPAASVSVPTSTNSPKILHSNDSHGLEFTRMSEKNGVRDRRLWGRSHSGYDVLGDEPNSDRPTSEGFPSG